MYNMINPMFPANVMPMPRKKLARAYIPEQRYDKSYTPPVALERGTMFPELYDPYIVPHEYGEGCEMYE